MLLLGSYQQIIIVSRCGPICRNFQQKFYFSHGSSIHRILFQKLDVLISQLRRSNSEYFRVLLGQVVKIRSFCSLYKIPFMAGKYILIRENGKLLQLRGYITLVDLVLPSISFITYSFLSLISYDIECAKLYTQNEILSFLKKNLETYDEGVCDRVA